MTKVGKSDGEGTFARTRGNDKVAPFSAIPAADHLPPRIVAEAKINDGSKSDVGLR
jgi:hypothetical protein